MSISKFEICVLGGGPAGSIIGGRLARLGHAVVIIDRCPPAQRHRVESLAPPVLPILDSLALSEAAMAAVIQCDRRVLVRWESFSVQSKILEPPAFLIRRSVFDWKLRELAAKAGAYVLAPASARTPERNPSGGWLISIRTAEKLISIAAEFLVDARGKRPSATIHWQGPKTAALSAAWKTRNSNFRETRIEAAENEWLWGCPIGDRNYSATIFLDSARTAGLGESQRERLYKKILASSQLLAGLLHGEIISPICIRDASSRIMKDIIGNDFIRIGEGAFSIDPLSSQGIQRAIISAIQGAAAVHTIRTGRDSLAAMAFFRDRQEKAAHRASAHAARFYQQSRNQVGAFWKHRHGRFASTLSDPNLHHDLPKPLPSHVRLSGALRVIDVPVLSETIIRPAPALSHPRLEQPIAFLGGIPLAPLVSGLVDGLTSEQLLTRWTQRIPRQTAADIFRWFCANGILEPYQWN
jgi:flavin-dependent dehydrogenase